MVKYYLIIKLKLTYCTSTTWKTEKTYEGKTGNHKQYALNYFIPMKCPYRKDR